MTTTIDLTQVTQALSKYVGTRYDASRVGGRSTMAAILRAQFDLSGQEAAELLDVLEQSCAIRWIPQPGADWMNNRLGLEIELGYWKLERSIG
jgi:hypothetical protein